MDPFAVHVSNVCKGFGPKGVLAGASLDMAAGEVWGLVGLNGAGKTTLIRVLLGLMKTDKGECRVLGFDPWRHQSDLYRRVGAVLEHNGFWGNLTVEENLFFFGEARGLSKSDVRAYLDGHWARAEIVDKTQKVKFFSRGEKMQCALCRAFMGWPYVLFLDEPIVALDLRAYDHFCELVRTARAKGSTVLISSHQLDAISDLCDRVAILENGAVSVLDKSVPATEHWIVKAPERPDYAVAIATALGSDPWYGDGVWHLRIRGDAKTIVPAVVSRLAALGCPIQEVRQQGQDLRNSIREHFDATAAKNGGG